VRRIEIGDQIVIGFSLAGWHVGAFPTALGAVPATGLEITVRATDILTILDGRVADIWVISDDLDALRQMGAVRLVTAP
jgi:hypothetical protein